MSIRPETWIQTAFGDTPQIRLLRVLATDRTRQWTEREAGSAAGLPASTTHATFRRLHASQLLELQRAGRSHLVRLRTDLQINQWLEELFRRERETLERALRAAAETLPAAHDLYLFGSTARAEAGPESDVDLIVIGPSREEAEEAADSVRRAIRSFLPTRVAIIALGRRESGLARYRRLMGNVRRDGRRIAGKRARDARG